jgi:hypothetical protein
LKTDEVEQIDKEALKYLHEGINFFVNHLHELTIELKANIEKELAVNKTLQTKVAERVELIKKSRNENIKRIHKDANQILEYAFLANAGGWYIYFVPIIFVLLTLKTISELVNKLIVMPVNEAGRFIPEPQIS